MACKPQYKGVRYNSLEELYKANGVNIQQAQQLYGSYLQTTNNPTVEGFKQWNNRQQQINELFESNPTLANEVYEALGFKNKLKTFLGKELEYKDAYISANRLKDFKQYQVLDEKGNDIGSVVIEYRGDKTVILHPKLTITGKGYGKDLYKLISSKFNVEIQEWNEGGISKSDSAKAMWDSLEKEGSAKRIIDIEQGDNFRILKYNNQPTPQQKATAQQLYSQYLDTIFPDSKVKDIVYHGTHVKFDKFDKNKIASSLHGLLEKEVEGFFFDNRKEKVKKLYGKEIISVLLNVQTPNYVDGQTVVKGKRQTGDALIQEANFRGEIDKTFVVFEPEQIHILGSKQDIEGFKKFIEESSEQPIEESFDKISEKYPEIEGILTENPVFTEDGVLLNQKSFKSSAQEAAYKIMQERVYGKELTQSDIQSINNELLKLSQSIGDTDWSLKVSSKGNYYVAGYKNRGVLFDSYYSPYAEGIFRQQESGTTIGQANLQAGTVLIDMVNGKADTPYHEYAHHFIGWFRNTEIVQEGIKKWGSEEALIQSIGEQALKQKGEAWNWWTRFVNWMKNLFGDMTSLERQELTNILTDAFLGRIDLETGKSLTTERINNLKELAKVTQPTILNQKQPTTTELKRAMGIRNNVSFNTLQRIKLSVDRYNDANNTSHKLDWKQNGISDSYDVDLIKDFTPVNAEWKAQRKEAWRQARTDDNLHGMENVSDAKFTAEELWLQKDIEKAKIIEKRLVSLYGADTVYDSLEILDEMFNLYTEDTSEKGRLIFLEQVLSGEYIIQC